jgi:His/Glu/Gln/Arg/opine family amino acid ABC transporter permease subunit
LEEIIQAFQKCFIEKDRFYVYLVKGLGRTLTITLFALIIGVALGFVIAVIRTTYDKTGKGKILNGLCCAFVTVFRGVPVVTQLLIFCYIIFASHDPGIMITAIVTFGLNSSAYVSEIVRSGIQSIDNGQFEAGRSLGFNYGQTMRFIILPQALKNVLPALGNEFIALLKETAIAGYIGVKDLTKGGDVIRSQTFEAFMPLIAVALIYLVLVILLSQGVAWMERRLKSSDR